MRTRRSAGGPAFPFPPTPEVEERALTVVENPETHELSIRRSYEVRPEYEVHSAETGDPSNGPFVYYSQTTGPNIHDQRLFQMEKKDGRWKMAFAWQAEGTGKAPLIMDLMTRMPDAFNRSTNTMLYDMDHILSKAFVMAGKLLGHDFMQEFFSDLGYRSEDEGE